MRAPPDHEIYAPPFPRGLPWINVASLRMDQQLGRPVLIEFWDFCRVNSLRTLPYVREWDARYPELRVIGVHTAGFSASSPVPAVRAAVARLEIPYAVVVDVEHEIWDLYGNLGWPARYLFDQAGLLVHYHYGEGAYDETEREIQRLLGVSGELVAPVRAEDVPGAQVVPQTADVEGPYSGAYEAGSVWGVFDGSGVVRVGDRSVAVDGPGCYELVAHERSTAGFLSLFVGEGVRCEAVCFTPGVK